MDNLFLHCSLISTIVMMLSKEVDVYWVIPKGCFQLLITHDFGKGSKAETLWICLLLGVFGSFGESV